MGEIDSEIGGRRFQSSGPQRHMTVPDESGYNEEYYNTPETRLAAAQRAAEGVSPQRQPQGLTAEQMFEARQQREANLNRASGHAKRRVELLVGIGRATRDVTINDKNESLTLSLRTLKSKEVRELLRLAQELAGNKDPDVIYAVRERTLAFSLYAIDGIAVDTVLGTDGLSLNEIIYHRCSFLNELDENMMNYIYSEYQALTNDNAKRFGVVTAEDAKEVAAEVKKSS